MSATASGHWNLVADIGGTNARFALTDPQSANPELHLCQTLPCAEFASLQHAVEHYLAQVKQQPLRAAIAVASPVASDAIRLTNRAWSFSRRELQQVLGLDDLLIINDFGAVAWAVPQIGPEARVALHGPALDTLPGPITVLGPGTGLGMALLVNNPAGDFSVVETEGGHVGFAPIGDEELTIARWMTAHFGRCSNERLLSGAGLSNIHAALSGVDPTPAGRDHERRSPADLVEAALAGHDLLARKTLARFCAVLGSVAGDAALIHGARSVVIAGGIVPRFIPFLRSSAFRERFLAKGRFAAHLESVGIHVVTHAAPGLFGAAVALRATHSRDICP